MMQNPTSNGIVGVRFVVQILDIDQSQKTATLQIVVFLDDFSYNESYVLVSIGGAGSATVQCNITNPSHVEGFNYQGQSAQTTWLLDGMGENFPFDSYSLHFVVLHMEYINNTQFSLETEGNQAYFDGAKAYSLNNLWSTNGNLIPINSIGSSDISFSIARTTNITIIYFLEFLMPTIACFYLLGSTLLLDPEKYLNERLYVYISLFVFVPLFLLAMRDFIPYRSSLSFPELLLAILILSNAIFAVTSIVGKIKSSVNSVQIIRLYTDELRLRKWDAIGIVYSLLFAITIYIFTLFGKLNIPTSLVFTYLVVPGYVCNVPFLITKKQFKEKLTRNVLILLLATSPGILLLLIWLL